MRTHAIRHHLLRIAAPLGFVMAGLATSANAFEPGNTECIAPAGAMHSVFPGSKAFAEVAKPAITKPKGAAMRNK